MAPPPIVVLDASVGVKRVLPEPFSERATALLETASTRTALVIYVPDLFFVECANILWKHVERTGYSSRAAAEHLRFLLDLPLHVVPAADVLVGALAIAMTSGISAYDASYVALSRSLGVPLITADQALARRMAGSVYDVRWLGDVPTPAAG